MFLMNNWKFKIQNRLNTCSNVRALISISSCDEVRDMPTNYSVPLDKPVFNDRGNFLSDNFTQLISGNTLPFRPTGTHELFSVNNYTEYWTGTSAEGALHSNNCDGWSRSSNDGNGQVHKEKYFYYGKPETAECSENHHFMCLCF
jgi:hypothetical protein